MSKTGLGPGAPRRGPFSSPNRFQIINNSVVSPPLFQNIIRKKSEKMRCERNGVERAYTRKIWKMPLPFWNFSSASPYSIFYRFSEKIENLLCPNRAKIFSFLVVQNPAPERGANCMPYPGKPQPIPHETPFLKHEFRDRRKWGTPWAAIYGFRAS